MNKLASKIINVVLALMSIVCFLALDFYGFGSNKNFTGADVMEMIEDGKEIWPVLFVIIPVIHIIIRFLTEKIAGGILTLPFTGATIFGVALGNTMINRGLKTLNKGLDVNKKVVTDYRYTDIKYYKT